MKRGLVAVLVVVLSACGGDGGGMVAGMPEAPIVAVPEPAAEPAADPADGLADEQAPAAPVQAPAVVLPDLAALLRIECPRAAEFRFDLDGVRAHEGLVSAVWDDPGDASYAGSYDVAGKRSGHWVIRDGHGEVYEGPFVDGKMEGHWVIRDRYPYDLSREGSFVDGKMEGRWELRASDGTVLEGHYDAGKLSGRWEWRFPDRTVYAGHYVAGKLSGRWEWREPDGTVKTIPDGMIVSSISTDDDGNRVVVWKKLSPNGVVWKGRVVRTPDLGLDAPVGAWVRLSPDGEVWKGRHIQDGEVPKGFHRPFGTKGVMGERFFCMGKSSIRRLRAQAPIPQ